MHLFFINYGPDASILESVILCVASLYKQLNMVAFWIYVCVVYTVLLLLVEENVRYLYPRDTC